jgi:hypothetical protein
MNAAVCTENLNTFNTEASLNNRLILEFNPHRKENTTHLHYKVQLIFAV